MASVTRRAKQVKQPRGGYINPKNFSITEIDDGAKLHPNENIATSLVGTAVEYLTRYNSGTAAHEAFKISLRGASKIQEIDYAEELLEKINGLDERSITNACMLSGFDVCFRANPVLYKPVKVIEPDSFTIGNIRTMVSRSLKFIEKYGAITKAGFTFDGGYTDLITSGDGDFLTETTLWDFKVSNKSPTNVHALQLLIYYLMGTRSIHKEFQHIRYLGVFNPRLNKVYLCEIDNIAPSILKIVSSEVIGYVT